MAMPTPAAGGTSDALRPRTVREVGVLRRRSGSHGRVLGVAKLLGVAARSEPSAYLLASARVDDGVRTLETVIGLDGEPSAVTRGADVRTTVLHGRDYDAAQSRTYQA
jgi:hypothetical protein